MMSSERKILVALGVNLIFNGLDVYGTITVCLVWNAGGHDVFWGSIASLDRFRSIDFFLASKDCYFSNGVYSSFEL